MSTMNKAIETVAQGTQQAQAALGQALEGFRANVANAASQFERAQGQGQAQAKANLEQTVRTSEALAAFGQGNLEAAMRSAQIWAAGVQDISRQIAEAVQVQVNETLASARTLAGAKSVKEAFEIQAGATRGVIERTVAGNGRVVGAYMTLAEQAAAPVLARFTAAIGTFTPAR